MIVLGQRDGVIRNACIFLLSRAEVNENWVGLVYLTPLLVKVDCCIHFWTFSLHEAVQRRSCDTLILSASSLSP